MSTVRRALGAAAAVLFAVLLSQWLHHSSTDDSLPPVVGANNTALFLVNSEHGLSNVHLATAHALLEQHPHVQVHFASFAATAPRLDRVSRYSRNPSRRDIVFHQLDGPSYTDVVQSVGKNTSNVIHAPGWAGIGHLCQDIQLFVSPWHEEDHMALYRQIGDIIDSVNPAVVVLDTIFRPAIDATRAKNRLHAIISPNTVIENFSADQPWGKMLWKYPAVGSGFSYPVPWSKIPENIILNFRFISTLLYMPDIKRKQAFLRAQGLEDPINLLRIHRPDAPWLSQTMPGASWPVDVIPPNVTCTGPMTVSLATVAEQDAELATWLARGPTVLINLGSGFTWSEAHAGAMAQAVAQLLRDTNVQVLWKMRKAIGDVYDDSFKQPLLPFIASGRVRTESWLAADPMSLLESGHVVASVHHGGAGCYHEALSAGVPQVILPMWVDLYGFAQLVQYIGVGVWGCPETSPYWAPGCLLDALRSVIDGDKSVALREQARKLGASAREKPGRYVAAAEVARLAGYGA